MIHAQRLAEWIASAPELEEDVALGNIALDQLGQARLLLSYAGDVEGAGRNEDDLAFFRDERKFLNLQLVELTNGDFAVTIAKLLLVSSYQLELYRRLSSSTDEMLSAIAAKATKEVAYHRDHATQWTLRLGDGTEFSHQQMQTALERVWPYLEEMFDDSWIPATLLESGVAVPVSELRPAFTQYVTTVIRQATLTSPEVPSIPTGGRRGIHTEAMGFLLAEMQHLARSHPGATW
nr:1,2-phenylacetyl-CoA epoxidase subunit PaaC [Microlunatus panaciterrae]